jgi:SAM-dependent methyltransferase
MRATPADPPWQLAAVPAPPPTARTADPYLLYQLAVQAPERDAAAFARWFRREAGRPLRVLREDFCGTAAIACSFVRQHAQNGALGVDRDRATLRWGALHNAAALTAGERARLRLVRADVRAVRRPPADLIVAVNFSYAVFRARAELLAYLRHCRRALRPGGHVLLDAWGGGLAHRSFAERHRHRGFDHVWEQRSFDPVTHRVDCRIHFAFRDGTRLDDAFVYDWRMWTLPELLDLLREAGFAGPHVLWPDAAGRLRRRARVRADPSWLAYVAGRRA